MMEAANAHSPFAAMMSASKRKRARSGRDVTDTESVKLQMQVAALQTQLSDATKKIEELMAVNRRLIATTVPAKKKVRGLRKISSNPLIFTIDDFVDAETCAKLLSGKGSAMYQLLEQDDDASQAQLAFASLVASELFVGQWGPNDGIRLNHANSSDGSDPVPCPDGLHVDTNNEAVYRGVTCILYLDDVPRECGGATVFPLAGFPEEHPALLASRELLAEQVTHTRGYTLERSSDEEKSTRLAALLEACADDETVLRVQPEAGMLCVFFTRTSDGEIDPRSWHGGERIFPMRSTLGVGCEAGDDLIVQKNIITLFKEVQYTDEHEHPPWDEQTARQSFESYLAPQVAAQRKYLEELAEAHAPFFEE